jgi:hypothetical protein
MMHGSTVQLLLVAEVVVDRRHVGLSVLADFADGGAPKAFFCENSASRFK